MGLSNANEAPLQQHKGLQWGASAMLYEDDFEKASAALQVIRSNVMDRCDYYKTPSFYKKVKCLLVSWDPACDDLHTEGEVRHRKTNRTTIADDLGL